MPDQESSSEDEMISMLHQGRSILTSVVVRYNREIDQYEVIVDYGTLDEEVVERADTMGLALRLGDAFLIGYSQGYDRPRADHFAQVEGGLPPHIHTIKRRELPPIIDPDRRN